jgi:HSP20 family protein
MNSLIPLTRIFDAALTSSLDKDLDTSWTMSPRADIMEGDREFKIALDLPGVKAGDMDISLENQTLTVKATRNQALAEGFQSRRRERPNSGRFERSFTLGSAVDADKIGARLEDGVLLITLPKSDKSLPRRIEVK